MPKSRSLSDNAQKKSKRLKTDPIGESQMPSTKEHSVPTPMTDQEFKEWSDRVAQELCDNLNRNVRLEEQEDRERLAQKK
jgi:hypothetical protein